TTGFIISSLALIATFKRTGWIGTAFGILIILIIRKQWKTIAFGVVLFIILLQFEKNVSELIVFAVSDNKIERLYEIETEGRATDVFELNGYQVVSDYENGISIYDDSLLVKNISTPAPVISFAHLKDELYLSGLVDTRFILFKRDNLDFILLTEIIPPGFTVDYKVNNGCLYVLDSDSGLTVYSFENNAIDRMNYPNFAGYKFLCTDSSKIYFSSVDSGLTVYELKNNLPIKQISRSEKKNLEYLYLDKKLLIASYPDGIVFYKTNGERIYNFGLLSSINNIRQITSSDNVFFIVKGNGELLELKLAHNDSFKVNSLGSLGFIPNSINFFDDKIYVTNVKRSRLMSIFDPYIPSNFNRIALWTAGFRIFKDHPVFGVGDIDLAELYKQYKRPYDKEIQGHMHNNFIHFLVTLGIFGFIAILFLFSKMIMIDYKVYKQVKDKPFLSSLALGTLASFCGTLAAGLTELNFWDQEIQTLIWFTFGLNFALFLLAKKESETHK
ncbi:MAG TPA: O-antigen ligase family protein, partial [Ignavibacteriaceae bacterium]